jgi:tetratricopeptide (TPR) repeat protein
MTNWFPAPKRTVQALASATIVVFGLCVKPTFAADFFRTTNPRPIGDNTQAAFESIFKKGDYKGAKPFLSKAEASEPNEPLVYAMQGALAFNEGDWETLKRYADKTLQTAEKIKSSDPLRGNLYTAAGQVLSGAYDMKKPGGSTFGALGKLQQVLQYVDAAKKVDPNDPELNLFAGYMDLILAVNIPFSDPSQAIDKLEKNAAPPYLVYRGIAVGYRDLKQYPKAMDFVDKALALTPDNPEVLHLKAQILRNQDKKQESLEFFKKAMEKAGQLPNNNKAQIAYEQCRLQKSMDNSNRDCKGEMDKIRQGVN